MANFKDVKFLESTDKLRSILSPIVVETFPWSGQIRFCLLRTRKIVFCRRQKVPIGNTSLYSFTTEWFGFLSHHSSKEL